MRTVPFYPLAIFDRSSSASMSQDEFEEWRSLQQSALPPDLLHVHVRDISLSRRFYLFRSRSLDEFIRDYFPFEGEAPSSRNGDPFFLNSSRWPSFLRFFRVGAFLKQAGPVCRCSRRRPFSSSFFPPVFPGVFVVHFSYFRSSGRLSFFAFVPRRLDVFLARRNFITGLEGFLPRQRRRQSRS